MSKLHWISLAEMERLAKAKNWDEWDLARHAVISERTMRRIYERGGGLRADTLTKLAKKLGVDKSALKDRNREQPSDDGDEQPASVDEVTVPLLIPGDFEEFDEYDDAEALMRQISERTGIQFRIARVGPATGGTALELAVVKNELATLIDAFRRSPGDFPFAEIEVPTDAVKSDRSDALTTAGGAAGGIGGFLIVTMIVPFGSTVIGASIGTMFFPCVGTTLGAAVGFAAAWWLMRVQRRGAGVELRDLGDGKTRIRRDPPKR